MTKRNPEEDVITLSECSAGSSKRIYQPELIVISSDSEPDLPVQEPEDEQAGHETFLGYMNTYIVGIQYYDGFVNKNEHVLFVREPHNTYDRNAIKVVNYVQDQIGHIPRKIASALALLIDQKKIRIEGKSLESKDIMMQRLPLSISIYSSLEGDLLVELMAQISGRGLLDAPQQVYTQINNIDSYLRTAEDLEQMSLANCPDGLTVTLLPYQQQGLQWMIDMENPELPQNDDQVVQFWKKCKFQGKEVFAHTLMKNVQTEPPTLMRGGLLADGMGLGKTVQVISLILHEKNMSKEKLAPTLIICPLSVVGNWVEQLETHVEGGVLCHFVYHGSSKCSLNAIKDFDLVITTYSILSNGFKNASVHPLLTTKWNRVILDESHSIRNKNTLQAKACFSLKARYRWCLSGTPLQNDVSDLFSLLTFLQFKPLDNVDWFRSLVQQPVKRNNPIGIQRLKELINCVSLRRLKDTKMNGKSILSLPNCEQFIHYVNLNDDEKIVYDEMNRELDNIVKRLMNEGRLMEKYACILEILLRLRQICNHTSLVADRKVDKRASKIDDPELLERLISILQESSDEECCICLDSLNDPLITPCVHLFCRECIASVLANVTDHRCPLCRRPISKNSLIEIPKTPEESQVKSDKSVNLSSKLSAVLEFCNSCTGKVILFSQWTRTLDILQAHLDKDSCIRFDGSLSRQARDVAIKKLQNDPKAKVMLMSLKAGAVGLNLTAANNVVLIDPWFNPFIEQQAIDRVYRLGQTKPVTVVRFIVKKSIEENVLALQEKKRELHSQAFREKRNKNVKEAKMEDLKILLRNLE